MGGNSGSDFVGIYFDVIIRIFVVNFFEVVWISLEGGLYVSKNG